jgi:hypothetical protein
MRKQVGTCIRVAGHHVRVDQRGSNRVHCNPVFNERRGQECVNPVIPRLGRGQASGAVSLIYAGAVILVLLELDCSGIRLEQFWRKGCSTSVPQLKMSLGDFHSFRTRAYLVTGFAFC